MGNSNALSSLSELIEAHEEALARWEAVGRQILDARHTHDELERAHEATNDAERAALAALMAHPVETLAEARLKAAYFLSLSYVRDFADDITLQF